MPAAMRQYRSAERALLKKRSDFEKRFRARSRCEGRRQQMVIADAAMRERLMTRSVFGVRRFISAVKSHPAFTVPVV